MEWPLIPEQAMQLEAGKPQQTQTYCPAAEGKRGGMCNDLKSLTLSMAKFEWVTLLLSLQCALAATSLWCSAEVKSFLAPVQSELGLIQWCTGSQPSPGLLPAVTVEVFNTCKGRAVVTLPLQPSVHSLASQGCRTSPFSYQGCCKLQFEFPHPTQKWAEPPIPRGAAQETALVCYSLINM